MILGIEGVKIGSYANVTATLKLGTSVLATDTVQLRVAPFVVFSNQDAVLDHDASTPEPPFGYVANLYGDNYDFRVVLREWLGEDPELGGETLRNRTGHSTSHGGRMLSRSGTSRRLWPDAHDPRIAAWTQGSVSWH